MDWANVTKIHTPPICQTLSPPPSPYLTSISCTKTISRPGIGNYRKSLLTWRALLKTVAPLSTVKHATQTKSCRLWYTVFRGICNTSVLFLFFAINFQNKARQALYFGIWECVRCRRNVYPDTLNDFPSWLSTSKNQPFFINNRGFTERYFSDKVHASLMIETALYDGASFPQKIYISFEISC